MARARRTTVKPSPSPGAHACTNAFSYPSTAAHVRPRPAGSHPPGPAHAWRAAPDPCDRRTLVRPGHDSYGYYAGELLDLLRKDGAAILQHAADTAREHGVTVDSVLYENLEKTVQQRVIAEAEMWKADLIVIGTHGRRASAAWCWAAAPRTSCAARPFPCCWCVRRPRRLIPGPGRRPARMRRRVIAVPAPRPVAPGIASPPPGPREHDARGLLLALVDVHGS